MVKSVPVRPSWHDWSAEPLKCFGCLFLSLFLIIWWQQYALVFFFSDQEITVNRLCQKDHSSQEIRLYTINCAVCEMLVITAD